MDELNGLDLKFLAVGSGRGQTSSTADLYSALSATSDRVAAVAADGPEDAV
jgi:hypothetical protein